MAYLNHYNKDMTPFQRKLVSLCLMTFCFMVFNLPMSLAFAVDGYTLLEPTIIIDQGGTQPTEYGLTDYLKTIYLLMFVLIISATVFYFILGGLEYITSDIPGIKLDGKSKIRKALLGLFIALTSYLLLNLINPDLLNLNLLLDAI